MATQFYKPIDPLATNASEKRNIQSITQFERSRRRKPINGMLFSIIIIGKMPKWFSISSIKEFISAFFNAEVTSPTHLLFDKKETKNNGFVSKNGKEGYLIQSSKKGNKVAYESVSFLDLLLKHYKKDPTFSVIGFIDEYMYEKDDYNQMGRACGNGACVISLKNCWIKGSIKQTRYEVLKTVSHELSHTFGMGHCSQYCCLMNPFYVVESYDKNVIEYCPICVQKLCIVKAIDYEQRWRQLGKYYAKIGFTYGKRWMSDISVKQLNQ